MPFDTHVLRVGSSSSSRRVDGCCIRRRPGFGPTRRIEWRPERSESTRRWVMIWAWSDVKSCWRPRTRPVRFCAEPLRDGHGLARTCPTRHPRPDEPICVNRIEQILDRLCRGPRFRSAFAKLANPRFLVDTRPLLPAAQVEVLTEKSTAESFAGCLWFSSTGCRVNLGGRAETMKRGSALHGESAPRRPSSAGIWHW